MTEIEQRLEAVQGSSAPKEWYSVKEVAAQTQYKEWTIRQACNENRISGKKGDDGKWRIPHAELVRLQEEGLPAK